MSDRPGSHNVDGHRQFRAEPLRCVECDIQSSADARHWRSYRTDDPSENEPPAVAFYCPTCAVREFGSLGPGTEQHWYQS